MKYPTLAEKRAKLADYPMELRVFDRLVLTMRELGTTDLPLTGPGNPFDIARDEGMPCDVSKLLCMIWQCDPAEVTSS